jgi:hypothetical protein
MYYSVDFRKRVLAYEEDHRIVDTAKIFDLSVRVISSGKGIKESTIEILPLIKRRSIERTPISEEIPISL